MLPRLLIFSLCFLIFSCEKKVVTPDELFSLELKEVMANAQEVDFPLFSPFEAEVLRDPVGAWLTLLEIDSKYCLFYHTPLNEKSGTLRLNHKTQSECKESFNEKVIIELDEVRNLKFVELPARDRKLKAHQEWEVQGEYKGNFFSWRPYAFNLSPPEEKGEPKKLSAFLDRGLKMIPEYNQAKKGSYSKRYADGETGFCHRVNENCEDVQEFSCLNCRYGHYEVVDYQCPQGGSKICGPSRCGQRGEPACPRGVKHLQKEKSEVVICEKASNAGFCEEGLVTHCDEDNVLICL